MRFRAPRVLALALLIITAFNFHSKATHLMGGSMTYEYMGMSGTDQMYQVTLKIYRYCDATGGGTAPLDFSALLGIYDQDPLNPNDDKNWFRTETLPLISSGFITPPSPGINCPFNTTVCVEEGIYQATILLPPSVGGYHLIVERCCRNGNIINLNAPGSIGQAYYCFIPASPIINSSPQFNDIPVPYICAGDQVTIVNNAVDPDGDSLVYSFEVPYSGYSGAGNPVPDPQLDNNPYGWPIPEVFYTPGYNVNSPFGAGGTSIIDVNTGLTTYTIPNQGFYVVVVEIKEYRNGVLIASVRRDLQLISITCPVNVVPVLSNSGGAGQVNYTITEGQTICFPVSFTDPDGDSLFLTSSGNIFNAAITNPPASLPNASGNGFVTSQFCWSTECGMAQATPYQFVATVTDNGCPPKVRNQIYSIKVNPSPVPPAPAVSIQQNPPGPVCVGTLVTFTALPTFGGTSPVYQWQLNGVNVGTNSPTWSSASLNNGDVITVSMTSNSVCVNTNTAVSAPVVMVVNPFAAPSVSVSAVPSGPVCAGTLITFNANSVNPGASPTYQWTVNGVNVGTNSPVFSSSTLTMGSVVSVTLTSDPACPAASSNSITMVVNPLRTPSAVITSNASGAICPGQSVTFQAFPTAGGASPSYQWQVNGVNVGSNSNVFTSSTLNNGDNVTVIMTSSESCLTAPSATSNVISITVTTPTNPSVSITANPSGPICRDDNVIFTATPVNGGATPSYQWQINGVTVFSGSNIFATSTLNNGDQVSVVLTTSLTCLTSVSATSNIIPITVLPGVIPSVNISISPGNPFCDGTSVTFTATPVNGGSNPTYNWQINGVSTGTGGSTFTSSTLNNNDRIRVTLTSNAACVSPVSAISNQIIVTEFPIVNPSVSITANPSGTICAGTNVTFTAVAAFGGFTPDYQWLVNGSPVGSNSNTFSSSTLNDGDVVRVRLISSAPCPAPQSVLSNQIVMDVDPIILPAVNISVTPAFPVCDGDPVTFTAVISGDGVNPVYQWQVNSVTQATGSSTFTTSTLNDGDLIRFRLVSDEACAQPAIVFSNVIEAEILPLIAPSVVISAAPSPPYCDGDSVQFNAIGSNAGNSPQYQWTVNGLPAGINSPTFSGVFNNSDTVAVIINSSYQCPLPASDTSNLIILDVLPNLTPAVSLTVNPQGPVCPGDVLTFTANPVNGGPAPQYQWRVNGVLIANTGSTFTTSLLQNGDVVRVRLISSETCLAAPVANSNSITVQISPNVQPDLQISVSPTGPVCQGDTLTFTSLFTGGGSAPQLLWRVNGVLNGVTASSFVSSQLNNGDVVDAVLISSAFCALPVSDTSNAIVAQIKPLLSPSAIIVADPPGIFCDGATITYSGTGTDGGQQPQYNWLLNGISLGVNNDTIISSSFQDGDTLQMVFTSSEQCLLFNPAFSNELIIERHPPLLPVVSATDEICRGEEALLSVQVSGGDGGPYYLDWSNGLGGNDSFTLLPYETTTYVVTVSDSCSTPRSDSVTIVVNPLPEVSFMAQPPSANILNSYFEFINQSGGGAVYNWDFGDGNGVAAFNAEHIYTDPGYYTVWLVAVSAEGCTDSTFRQIFVEDVVTVYVPNSFTPNGDGVNDLFGPVGNSMSGYDLRIYNRWGQVLFASESAFDKWNGNGTDGKQVPDGVYVYTLRVKNDPDKKIRRGTVTLVR